ncbi:hypothetical protein I3F58_03635 [Streptomyces sp. MUM 203J]|uniref:hypothetical protein n=1 Tax=Streptomyces sp. MUM 203J TaxID=2791990 RepID=UPI001F04076E|nr:hypothetical protein [Streptomyces sp. MUM 203J]MCH0538665.1 hypothetical protein [Streptomyces sp. MUM 203J]
MGDGARTEGAGWWDRLPAGIRAQVDAYVLQDARLHAVRTVWEAGRAQGLGLHEAQLVVHRRYARHGDRIARTPDDPLDVESLAARASSAPGPVAAVEAVWDGDTVHDWFVLLLAVTADPPGDHRLATVHADAAVRFLGDGPRGRAHPSAAAAERAGRAPAGFLSVPFHFASPDTPDDEAPRGRS